MQTGSELMKAFDWELERDLENLEKVFQRIEDFCRQHSLGEDISFALQLSVEELFTNMVKYRPDNKQKIRMELKYDGEVVAVTLTEYGVDPFDITKHREYDGSTSIEDRPVGGLGIHLIRKFMDEVEYECRGRASRVRMLKKTGV